MHISFDGELGEFNALFHIDRTPDPQVLALLQTLVAQGEHMADSIETLKKNQALMKEDLDTIGAAVIGALDAYTKLKAENEALRAQIDALVAGDTLTQEKLDSLVEGSDSITEQADAIAQSLTPVKTVAEKHQQ